MDSDLVISFLTPYSISGIEFAELFYELTLELLPSSHRFKFDVHEPARYSLSKHRDKFLEIWHDDPFWTDRPKQSNGSVYHCSSSGHSMLDIVLPCDGVERNDFAFFFETLSVKLNVDFSFVTPFWDSSPLLDRHLSCVTTHELQKEGIPEIPWMFCFGKPYIEMFGEQVMKTSNDSRVVKLAPSTFLLRSPFSMEQFLKAGDAVENYRSALKIHLGENAFGSVAVHQSKEHARPGTALPKFKFYEDESPPS